MKTNPMQLWRLPAALFHNFLDSAPVWYKLTVIGFLVLNPVLLAALGPFTTGWIIIAEFIFFLAMALKCYPLPAAGLLAIEVVVMGLATTEGVYSEVEHNFPVLLLLMFMVAAIYFQRQMLLVVFSNILVKVRSKVALSLIFCGMGAFLSAFLDALTVTAVVIAVAVGFFQVYHRFASSRGEEDDHDHTNDDAVHASHRHELDQFRGFLRNLLMHAAVGTALGGVCTLVGEPQNVIIGHIMGWNFNEFAVRVAPVSIPTLIVGLFNCFALEKFRGYGKIFGYGYPLPETVRGVMAGYVQRESRKRTIHDLAKLLVQGIAAVTLVMMLATHVAEVGLIGLTIIILLTSFNGVTEEHRIGHAFTESLPFAGLLVVFFAIVAMIHEQHLFAGIIDWTLSMEGTRQLLAFFWASGGLSTISDNVFVASVYISEAQRAFEAGLINRAQFDLIAVAINTGTNIPSVATPNGQAAFLFLLTSPIAGLIKLNYGRMLWLAFPYTITMSITATLAVLFLL